MDRQGEEQNEPERIVPVQFGKAPAKARAKDLDPLQIGRKAEVTSCSQNESIFKLWLPWATAPSLQDLIRRYGAMLFHGIVRGIGQDKCHWPVMA